LSTLQELTTLRHKAQGTRHKAQGTRKGRRQKAEGGRKGRRQKAESRREVGGDKDKGKVKGKLIILVVALVALAGCSGEWIYHYQEGFIYGSTYHITYEYKARRPLERPINGILERIDKTMSIYDSTSLISRINRNDPEARLDTDLIRLIATGREVWKIAGGAFDMTVAPLVNAWGFGFTERQKVTQAVIDSLLTFTGFEKVAVEGDRLIKQDPRIMIDPNAIAPGYVVDIVSEFLESADVVNYLVEIGGELRCGGLNPKGIEWRVGIDKPLENTIERQIQQVLHLSDISVATSGNYRKFYEEDGVKYSHTINPKTGYPARSNLLSATVLTKECVYADAYATVFMVLGLEKSIELAAEMPELEVYFIYADESGDFRVYESPGIGALIHDSTAEQEQP
jgi:thiamine biosynthesis lipoprotein